MGRILRKDVRARELIDDRGEATVASLIDERQRIAKGAFGGLLPRAARRGFRILEPGFVGRRRGPQRLF